VAKGFLL